MLYRIVGSDSEERFSLIEGPEGGLEDLWKEYNENHFPKEETHYLDHESYQTRSFANWLVARGVFTLVVPQNFYIPEDEKPKPPPACKNFEEVCEKFKQYAKGLPKDCVIPADDPGLLRLGWLIDNQKTGEAHWISLQLAALKQMALADSRYRQFLDSAEGRTQLAEYLWQQAQE